MTEPRRVLWMVIGVLAALLMLEWLWPDAGSPAIPLRPARIAGHVAHDQAVAVRDTSGWGSTILDRPLFSISRRPPRTVAGNHAETAVGQARLSGIMITRQGRRAIFAPDGGGKQMVLAEGASVNESTIQRIQPDRVTLASGAVLLPSFDHTRTGPPPTTPPYQPPANGFPSPGFPNPGFPNQGFPIQGGGNPGFPNPGFPNPGLANPGFPNPNFPGLGAPGAAYQQQGQAPNDDDAGSPAAAQPTPPVTQPMQPMQPPLRGAMIPQRRE